AVPAAEERLAWLTGCTGSAGVAIVLMERAILFVDGRYTLQAREQVDPSLFTIEHLVETPPDKWIEQNLTRSDRLGYDPWLHTVEGAERLAKACAPRGAPPGAAGPGGGGGAGGRGGARTGGGSWGTPPPPRHSAPSRCMIRALPARPPRPSSSASAPSSPSCAPTRSSFRIPMRSPGHSTSA